MDAKFVSAAPLVCGGGGGGGGWSPDFILGEGVVSGSFERVCK